MNESSFKILYFKKAEIDTVENINKTNSNNLHLCWLKNDKGRTGYLAISENNGHFNIIAFSATNTSPDYFLKKLELYELPKKQLNLSNAKQVSFIENVPLVAAAKTTIGTEPIEISEIAASLSSLFNFIQNEKKILFFGHTGFSDPEYTRRFLENPDSASPPDDSKWKSIDDEIQKATNTQLSNTFSNLKLRELSSEQRVTLKNSVRQIIKPIIKKKLLNPAYAAERLQVILRENDLLTDITRTDISPGIRDAISIQQDYLNGNNTKLQQNLNIFFKTRGRTAKIEIIPFEKLQSDSLPVILTGPDNIAAVLLGFIDIDNERFASVFFPKNGNPLKMSLSEKKRRMRKEQGIPEPTADEEEEKLRESLEIIRESEEKMRKAYEEKGLPIPEQEKSAEDEFLERVERIKTADDNMFFVEDRNSDLSEQFTNGIHLINCSTLSSWQVLSISEIQIGDNW
ncbi:MAG: hypothetical protein JXA96_06575 [Sedimentisphaerales bacterium]|nr:hypothetical protein [Sedimentisphaerales bacterium]